MQIQYTYYYQIPQHHGLFWRKRRKQVHDGETHKYTFILICIEYLSCIHTQHIFRLNSWVLSIHSHCIHIVVDLRLCSSCMYTIRSTIHCNNGPLEIICKWSKAVLQGGSAANGHEPKMTGRRVGIEMREQDPVDGNLLLRPLSEGTRDACDVDKGLEREEIMKRYTLCMYIIHIFTYCVLSTCIFTCRIMFMYSIICVDKIIYTMYSEGVFANFPAINT